MYHLSDIRKRKILQYLALLPDDCGIGPVPDQLTELTYSAFLARLIELAPPGFALTVGSSRRLTDLGLIGHLVMSCARLRDTYEVWNRHAEMAGEPVSIISNEAAGVWTLEFVPKPFLPSRVAAFCSEEMCASVFAFAREVTGHDFTDFTIELAHMPQAGVAYDQHYPCPVTFGHRKTRILGPASALDLQQLSRDQETFDHLLRHFREQDSRLRRFADMPFSLQLYDHFLRQLGNEPRLDRAARVLGTSTRSLVRQLASEGTSFGEVLDEFRHAYAVELLRDTEASPKQVAHALGFASENSLRRVFQRWTGKPIGAWRRQLRSLQTPS